MAAMKALVLLGFCALAQAITLDDLYPFDVRFDPSIDRGDTASSPKIPLAIPAFFYQKEYDYLWINTDGFVSFERDTSDVQSSDFPFHEALLAPYMDDLDTTAGGAVYYREHRDGAVLSKATRDVRRVFDETDADFEAESVFVMTWKDVIGRSVDDETATFTFQAILVSNWEKTFAIFLYPEHSMGVVALDAPNQEPMFRARAGFNEGPHNHLQLFPVENLMDYKNTERNGEWIFQVGGEGVRRSRDVITPQVARHRKRQASTLINVQEVSIGDDVEVEGEVIEQQTRHDYCAREQSACPNPNSRCVNSPNGYCCKCESDYLGNGAACIPIEAPVRVNGNVTGTVDVRSADESVERVTVRNVDFHSFAIANQGRAYTAVSKVTPTLGRALQPLDVVGEAIGWLFADAEAPAINGFQYTGGAFQRRVSVRYADRRYRFDMRQKFLGLANEGDAVVVLTDTNFVGSIPGIPEGAKVSMDSMEVTYVKQGQGQISSKSTRSYNVDNTTYSYDVTETIVFRECADANVQVPNNLKLEFSGIFLNYHSDDDNVRFAMNTKTVAPEGSSVPHPCDSGENDCDVNAECQRRSDQEYSCRCHRGYAGDGRSCAVDPCYRSRCPRDSICVALGESYDCECMDGLEMNADGTDCTVPGPAATDPCGNPNLCGIGTCVTQDDSYSCDCPSGFYFDGNSCVDIDECRENRDNCAINAECINEEASFQCICNPGYQGNGETCTAIVAATAPPVQSECWRQFAEAEALLKRYPDIQDGPNFPDCMDDGTFASVQCNDFTNVCWCADPTTGSVIDGTMSGFNQGHRVRCSSQSDPVIAPPTPPAGLTQCQNDRWQAEQRSTDASSQGAAYVPICTAAGAYEPIQHKPNGEFLCVDFNGVVVSRHRTLPTCLTTCQLTKYYAETENAFAGARNFVVQCTENGNYARIQCDENTNTCYCANQNGEEVAGSRVETGRASLLDCDRLDPNTQQSRGVAQLIFAQAMRLNTVSLPISSSSTPETLSSRARSTRVGVAVDCDRQALYWTDVSSGAGIYTAPLSSPADTLRIAQREVKSPEGVAVDYVSGNVYWTDSGLRRIEVARYDGTHRTVLITSGLNNPRGIAVDPFGGKLYWSDWYRSNPRIMRSNLDGTAVEEFLKIGLKLPNDITFDSFYRKLCFIDAGLKRVECVNTDGTQRNTVIQLPLDSPMLLFGLAVDGRMVYYTDRRGGKVYAVNMDSGETVSVKGPVGSHGQMLGVAIAHTRCAYGVNACTTNNGGCPELCLPIPGGRVCKCPSGAYPCGP